MLVIIFVYIIHTIMAKSTIQHIKKWDFQEKHGLGFNSVPMGRNGVELSILPRLVVY